MGYGASNVIKVFDFDARVIRKFPISMTPIFNAKQMLEHFFCIFHP